MRNHVKDKAKRTGDRDGSREWEHDKTKQKVGWDGWLVRSPVLRISISNTRALGKVPLVVGSFVCSMNTVAIRF